MNETNGLTIITPRSLAEAKDLANTLAQARTIPDALQKSPSDVLAIVMAGAELGLAPMQSVRALVLIKGKPTLSADAMGALVKSRRDVCEYLLLRTSDATKAVYETKRVGDPAATTMGFTIEEARTAKLNGDNWQKFPNAMLRARALSAICRAVYPDLLLGVYEPDELAREERDVTPKAEVVDAAPAVAAAKDAVKAAVAKRRMNVVDEPPPTPPEAKTEATAQAPAVDAVVTFGPQKGLPISGLSTEEIVAAIDLGEANVAKEPGAGWVRGVTACIAQLRAEQQHRFDELTNAAG